MKRQDRRALSAAVLALCLFTACAAGGGTSSASVIMKEKSEEELTRYLGKNAAELTAAFGESEDVTPVGEDASWYGYDGGAWFTVADGVVTSASLNFSKAGDVSYTIYGIGAQSDEEDVRAAEERGDPDPDGAHVWIDGNRCLFRTDGIAAVSAEATYRPPVLTFPHALGSTECRFADGTSLTLELYMTGGRLMRSADADYVPGGGITGNENYIGTFELRSLRGGEELARLACPSQQSEEGELVFHGPVSIEPYDYNGDGKLEFALGEWGSSWMTFFTLYSVSPDGAIELVQADIADLGTILDTAGFEPAKDGFTTRIYHAADETYLHQRWAWNGAQFAIVEETVSKDP